MYKDFRKFAVNSICDDLVSQINEIFIEGLAREGFSFNDKDELEKFIKSRCTSLKTNNTTMYCVDNIPFLTHIKNFQVTDGYSVTNEAQKLVGDVGLFEFL